MSTKAPPRRISRHRERDTVEDSDQVETPAVEPVEDVNGSESTADRVPADIAHPLRRLYGFLIDMGLMLAVVYFVAPLAGGRLFSPTSAVIDVFVFFGYFVFTTGIFGRTLGKWVAGTKVVNEDGQTPGVAAAIPREMAGRFVAVVAAGVGLIWIAFDANRQGWHDKMAATYVVNTGPAGPSFLSRFLFPSESEQKKDEAKANKTRKPASRVGERPTSYRRRRKRRRGR